MKNWQEKILHLGLGRFHRAHQAVYYQRMAEYEDSPYGVVALSMRSPGARDDVRSTGMKYPVIELSEHNVGLIWVESIRRAFDAQEDAREVEGLFANPGLEIITLTVTEKGYCLKGDGSLDLSHPGIAEDLKATSFPSTAIGLLAQGLKKRTAPLTIICCDNLRENGTKLEQAVKTYLHSQNDEKTLKWMSANVSFPNTMVDRIVPALTPEKTIELEDRFGLNPHSGVIATEEFTQWVIEDKFKTPRPAWEKVGVQFVEDVRPFEEMKLRMLNASHSFLAYAGRLLDYQYVHEAIADAHLQSKVELLMLREVLPLIKVPEGYDIVEYEESLIRRFRNNQLPHQLKQIAMDGSQKLPQRILPSLLEAHLKNSSKEVLMLAVCAWMNYCWKTLEKNPQDLDDPLRPSFQNFNRTDRFSFFKDLISSAPFEILKGREDLRQLILQNASTYSLLLS